LREGDGTLHSEAEIGDALLQIREGTALTDIRGKEIEPRLDGLVAGLTRDVHRLGHRQFVALQGSRVQAIAELIVTARGLFRRAARDRSRGTTHLQKLPSRRHMPSPPAKTDYTEARLQLR
jgi:hypothetical protein